MAEDILTIVAERDRYRAALESMVAAFDGEGYGDKSIVEETRKAALKCAIEDLGWDRTAPFPERHPEIPIVQPSDAVEKFTLLDGVVQAHLCDKHAERRIGDIMRCEGPVDASCDDCVHERLQGIMRETDHLDADSKAALLEDLREEGVSDEDLIDNAVHEARLFHGKE